ncbi:hypothetical protein [Enhygromyxa salina]|uniref:hypothetical protein n=1 Tax=Enhygromyxa salina TaxID=215803 RepID=UPI000695BE3C|nr:hypothetical protein [Enhygromyxa salina]
MRTKQDGAQGERVAQALLSGAGFSAFTFSTSFSLRFSRDRPGSLLGYPLPAEVELDLDARWWLDDEQEWKAKVARLAPEGAVEPEEPVQAYELAALRWTEGTTVVSVVVSAGMISVRFGNGRLLTATGNAEDDGRAWTLSETGVAEKSARWSVCSEGGVIFVRAPCLSE